MLATEPLKQQSPFFTFRIAGLRDMLRSREQRVVALLVLVAVLSGFDLIMTLQQMMGYGMLEANPIVVRLVQVTNSPTIIIVYKALTVAIGLGLVLKLRRYASAEAGACLMAIILLVLSVNWIRYAVFFNALDPWIIEELSQQANWVMISRGA